MVCMHEVMRIQPRLGAHRLSVVTEGCGSGDTLRGCLGSDDWQDGVLGGSTE
jgi:hypothetical protein